MGAANIVLVLLMLAVAGVLATGLVAMVRGGEFNEKHGNRLMQWRVYLQGAALLLLGVMFLLSNKQG